MTTSSPRRVVVADDSALMRQIVANSLKRAGFDVVGTAADGDQALALCEREKPDAMTLDLAMPGLDGLGVLRKLKERRGPSLPVVVVSAFSPSQGARAVDALAEGAFDLVAKPSAGELDGFSEVLAAKVKIAADSGVSRPVVNGANGRLKPPAPRPVRRGRTSRVVVIATSTGG